MRSDAILCCGELTLTRACEQLERQGYATYGDLWRPAVSVAEGLVAGVPLEMGHGALNTVFGATWRVFADQLFGEVDPRWCAEVLRAFDALDLTKWVRLAPTEVQPGASATFDLLHARVLFERDLDARLSAIERLHRTHPLPMPYSSTRAMERDARDLDEAERHLRLVRRVVEYSENAVDLGVAHGARQELSGRPLGALIDACPAYGRSRAIARARIRGHLANGALERADSELRAIADRGAERSLVFELFRRLGDAARPSDACALGVHITDALDGPAPPPLRAQIADYALAAFRAARRRSAPSGSSAPLGSHRNTKRSKSVCSRRPGARSRG